MLRYQLLGDEGSASGSDKLRWWDQGCGSPDSDVLR